ncbi:hypothetical protein SMX40_003423, partial [Cronobacter turicensis]|nr:hypothetical protein [Cronobacter turicensis]
MLNKEVIDDLIWLWSLFDIRLLTFIAACFTIYLGYQKVDKKVSVSYSLTTDLLYGTHISNIILANKRDNVITINSVLLTIGEEGRVILFKTENPLIVKAYETTMVEIPKYSYLTNGSANVTFDFNKALNFSILTAYGKVIDCVEDNHILTDEAHKTISK